MTTVKITQVRSTIGQSDRHLGTSARSGSAGSAEASSRRTPRSCADVAQGRAPRARRREGCLAVGEELNLSSLRPAQARKGPEARRPRRGVGVGQDRGSRHEGPKSRSGRTRCPPASPEGGQMPIDMRLGKLRGTRPRTRCRSALPHVYPARERGATSSPAAGAEVTPEALKDSGLIRKLSVDEGPRGGRGHEDALRRPRTPLRSAVEKIEAAGGTRTRLREPVEKKKSG